MSSESPIIEPPPLPHPYTRDRQIAHGTDIHDRTPPPFDIVGDVHGCIDELLELLELLGYRQDGAVVHHPEGRTLVFLGDLNDRGPGSIRVWQIAGASLDAGTARFVPGNHDSKLARYLMGRHIRLTHGLEGTVRELEALPGRERRILGRRIGDIVADAAPYRILDGGRLVVAHAGVEEWMIGKVNHEISVFARFGEPTGERSAYGFPIRRDWAATYRGAALVVYGHTPVLEAEFRNHTLNIDQGCAFGGMLTALRYPELETVSVPARAVYWEPSMAERFAREQLSADG